MWKPTSRIPDGTITIDEWEPGWLGSNNSALGHASVGSFRRFPRWESENKRLAHFSAIQSTSFASPFLSFAGGGMDPVANTASWHHSNSVNASASVPISQLCIVHQLATVVEICLGEDGGKEVGKWTDLSLDIFIAFSRTRLSFLGLSSGGNWYCDGGVGDASAMSGTYSPKARTCIENILRMFARNGCATNGCTNG